MSDNGLGSVYCGSGGGDFSGGYAAGFLSGWACSGGSSSGSGGATRTRHSGTQCEQLCRLQGVLVDHTATALRLLTTTTTVPTIPTTTPITASSTSIVTARTDLTHIKDTILGIAQAAAAAATGAATVLLVVQFHKVPLQQRRTHGAVQPEQLGLQSDVVLPLEAVKQQVKASRVAYTFWIVIVLLLLVYPQRK